MIINIEEELFSAIAAKVRSAFPNIYLTGEYVKSPPSFPCSSIEEKDNSSYAKTQTNSDENYVHLMYEVNTYSNKLKGKKAECKAIMALIDEIMTSYGLVRTMLQPIPNEYDATIYRMTARYTGVADKNKTIYRR